MAKATFRVPLAAGVAVAIAAGCAPARLDLLATPPGPTSSAPAVSVIQDPLPAEVPAAAWADQDEPVPDRPAAPYLRHDLLVAVEPGASEAAVLRQVPGARIADRITGLRPIWRLVLPAGQTPQGAAIALRSVPGVRYASLNRRYSTSYTFAPGTQDTYYPQQWAHQSGFADTQGAWDVLAQIPNASASQNRIIVAVLDTGLDVGHPKFAGRVISPINFTSTNSFDVVNNVQPIATQSNVVDTVGHGTHCAGIIAAAGGTGTGVAGVAWNARIMPVKVLGSNDSSSYEVLKGLYYAAGYVAPDGARVRVISMSLGVTGLFHPEVAVDQAVTDLYNQGIVCCIAAGNESGPVTSPANVSKGIAVSSTSNLLGYEFLSGFSNFGPRIDVAAPGGNIWSTVPRAGSEIGGADARANPYKAISGTSMATPYVAGVAALICARYASESAPANQNAAFSAKVVSRLRQATDNLGEPGHNNLYGYGRVNARKAITPATLDQSP
jgi:subtilisin family serine protease